MLPSCREVDSWTYVGPHFVLVEVTVDQIVVARMVLVVVVVGLTVLVVVVVPVALRHVAREMPWDAMVYDG